MSDPNRSDPNEKDGVKVVDRRWWAREAGGADADTPSDWQPDKPTFVEELQRQLAEKDTQLQDVIKSARQSQREFEEARARLRKDVQRDVERSRRAFLADLLEVVDNLDRALDAARQSQESSPLVEGVDLVRRQFLGKLEPFGVRRVDPQGQTFDPAVHEAVTAVSADDKTPDGTIVGVIAPGYMIGDDVLRHAQVAVARAATDSGATDSPSPAS